MIIKGKNEYIIHGDTMFFFFYLEDDIRKDLEELGLLMDGDCILIKNGFKWNGANMLPDIDFSVKLSCIHDYLYDKGVIKTADKLLRMMMESRIIEITPHVFAICGCYNNEHSTARDRLKKIPMNIGSWIVYQVLNIINKFRR